MRFFFFIAAVFILFGCGGKKVKPTVSTSLQTGKLPVQESWDDTVVFSDSGKTRAVLYAGNIKMYNRPPETLLDSSIKIDFYSSAGKKTSVLTALRGRVDDATKNLYAIDSVVAVSDSGVTLKTQELMWRNKDQKIVSDKFVTIISPKEKIQGYGFESDQSLTNYTIYNITYITRTDTSNQKSSGYK